MFHISIPCTLIISRDLDTFPGCLDPYDGTLNNFLR